MSQNLWTEMKHNGVMFPPEYEPLPKDVQILYENKPVVLDSQDVNNPFGVTAEEAMLFYATKLAQDDRLVAENKKKEKSKDDKTFTDNFWKDWKIILGKNSKIKDWKKIDFTPVQRYVEKRSEEKKEKKTKEEKEKMKEEKEQIKNKYGYATIDGEIIPIGAYVIQPPGLYIGHGNTPLRGQIKGRVKPSDVTLNITAKYAPECSYNGKKCEWGEIIQEKGSVWIAKYPHPLTGETNYVWLKRDESKFVSESDQMKFDKARYLGKNIKKIRENYTKDMKGSDSKNMQLSTAVYLLDEIAIRPGTEKDEETEADTQGLTTLRCENISFGKDNILLLKFIGKSGMEFNKEVKISEQATKNLKKLCQTTSGNKKQIFPDVNASSLNSYLKTLLEGLTAKNFRTWKASETLQKELDKLDIKSTSDDSDKKIAYDNANTQVALALNHKRLAGDTDVRVKKNQEKIKEVKDKLKEATTDKQKESCLKKIKQLEQKVVEIENNVALATSKTNYLDPRITVAWCKKMELPIEKIYNKSSLTRFKWAMDTVSKWNFLD